MIGRGRQRGINSCVRLHENDVASQASGLLECERVGNTKVLLGSCRMSMAAEWLLCKEGIGTQILKHV